MLNVKSWTLALGLFAAFNFALAVVIGLLAPPLPINHGMLERVLLGFVWISPGSFVFGLIETFLLGAYGGFLFSWMHNVFAPRAEVAVPKSTAPQAKAA